MLPRYASAFLLPVLWCSTMRAQPGTLDGTFGDGGVVRADAGASDILRDLAVQPDGRIVATGWSYTDVRTDLLVARFNADGGPDMGFSGDGHLVLPTGEGFSGAEAVDVLPDGRILVAGYSNNGTTNGSTVWRFLADGTLDASFATNGVFTDFAQGDASFITDMTVQPDGHILLTGPAYFGDAAFLVERLNANGTPDMTFNGNGRLRYPADAEVTADWTPNRLRLLSDGRIVIAGSTEVNGDPDVCVMRCSASGTWDATFNGNGVRVIASASYPEYGYNLDVRPDGRYVITGETLFNNTYDALFAQLDGSGANSNFNGTSMWSVNHGASEYCRGALLQNDGKVVVAGSSVTVAGANAYLFRSNGPTGPEGGDGLFGSSGWVHGDFGDWTYVEAMVQQADGQVIIAGNTASGGAPYDMMLARYALESTTGIAEDALRAGLSLYPSPNTGTFTLGGTHAGDRLTVRDAQGRSVHAQRANEGSTVLSVQLPAGVYSAEVIAGDARRTLRFVIH